jgi:hypothetical protein
MHHLLHIAQVESLSDTTCWVLSKITFWYHTLYNHLIPSAVYCTVTFLYICCTLYDHLLIHLLHIVWSTSGTSAAHCTNAKWYICCILYYHLLRPSAAHCMITVAFWYHLLHIVWLPSDTSAAHCSIANWYICCLLYDYSCLLLPSAAHFMLSSKASPVCYTITWYQFLHTLLSYYGWCCREHEAF